MERDNDDGFSLLNEKEVADAKEYTPEKWTWQRRPKSIWRKLWRKRVLVVVSLVVLTLVGCLVLVILVLKLKDTNVSLVKLHLPDLCNKTSIGMASLQFDNPSFCEPFIGPIFLTVDANSTDRLMDISINSFPLASGKTDITSLVTFSIVANASTLQRILFESPSPQINLAGKIPVHLGCLLVPFTVTLDAQDLIKPSATMLTSSWTANDFDIATRVREMIQSILKSIALSEGHIEQDREGVYLFTDVTFTYSSNVQWTLPDLTFRLAEKNSTLLTAGLYGFPLGSGVTHLDSFAYLRHNDSTPLLDAVTTYLKGQDVYLQVIGDDTLSRCFAQRLWNDMHFPVDIPATVDGKPAFLRHYALDPTLKKLDSTTRTCELRLDVALTIHNPLPFELILRSLEFELLYANATEPKASAHVVASAIDSTVVDWKSHMVNDVNFGLVVTDFDVCEDLLVLYLSDALEFSIHKGSLALGLGQGKTFTIPFEVDGIRIHPPPDNSNLDSFI
ncbi:unnamed protein product [Aphanomyces euteiches]